MGGTRNEIAAEVAKADKDYQQASDQVHEFQSLAQVLPSFLARWPDIVANKPLFRPSRTPSSIARTVGEFSGHTSLPVLKPNSHTF
jgi:hypothetical protein